MYLGLQELRFVHSQRQEFNLPLLVALAIAPQGITREDVRQYIEDSKKQMELVELEADDSRDEDFFA